MIMPNQDHWESGSDFYKDDGGDATRPFRPVGGDLPPEGTPGPRKPRKKLSGGAIAGIAAGVLALLVLAAFLVYRAWARQPDLPVIDEPVIESLKPADPDSTSAPEDDPNAGKPYLSGERKDGFYTFLIVGRDTGGGGNTDTIMLASYNTREQDAALMSIPRDTMVNAPWDIKRINSVYNVYEASERGSGVPALREYVAGLTGFEADFTVIVEWDAVGKIVDAIGGVWFDVPFDMKYDDPSQNLHIDQDKGYRKLDGDDAMEVVRWRRNNFGSATATDGSDLARVKIQQSFVAAVLKQCLQIQNITKLNQIAGVFTEHVETELSAGNLAWFAEQALTGGFSSEDLFACTMPYEGHMVYSRTLRADQSYVVPVADELIELVNEHFNPYQADVKLSNLDIMSVNGDGSLSSTSGMIRDERANSARP